MIAEFKDSAPAVDSAPLTAEQAFDLYQDRLQRYRRAKLKEQMLEAIEEDPFRSYLPNRFGKQQIAAELIFEDATQEIRHLFIDIARECKNGHDVSGLAKSLFEEIALNYADKHTPPASKHTDWLTLPDIDEKAANEAIARFRAADTQPYLTAEEFDMHQKDEVSSRNAVGLGVMAAAIVATVVALVWLAPLGQLVSGFTK